MLRCKIQAAFTLASLLLASHSYAQKSGKVEDGIQLALPFQAWGVRLDNPGTVVEYRQMKSGTQAYLMSSHPDNGINVSITIEHVAQPPAPDECGKSLEARKASFGPMSGLRTSRIAAKSSGAEQPPTVDVMEFLLDRNEFAKVRQKNFLACFTTDNAFVDIHLSKGGFVPADQAVMEQVLQSLRVVKADASIAPATEGSREVMGQASRRYLARDYKAAVPLYERALQLQELDHRLSHDLWRVAIDNLGMSLAFSGNLDAAEGVFRYGVSKDPAYPMFHYNLACARAERKDLPGAMAELRIAFLNRQSVIEGESMPDPAKDDSFTSFMRNPDFTQFLKELR